MDLEHQRPGPGTAGEQPALDLEPVALPATLHGLDEGQLRGELVVEARDGARRGGRAPGRDVEDDDLGEGSAGRADRDHDVALAPRGRAGVPAGEVVAVRREALGPPAAGDRHAPQLHRAVDGCREQDVRPVRGGRDGRLAADRHVAVHRGVRLELAAGEEVRAAARARVGAVRGEAPDARPVAGPREAVAEGEDRGAVAGPGGVREGGVGAAGDRRHFARRNVHDVDPGPPVEIGVRPPVRGKGDPRPVRRPGGPGLRRRAAHQDTCRAGDHVHEPQVVSRGRPRTPPRCTGSPAGRCSDSRTAASRRAWAWPAAPRRSSSSAAWRPGSWSGPRAGCRPATRRTPPRRAAGPSGGAPRRRRAAAGGPGRSPRGPSPPWAGPAPPRSAGGGPR